MLTRERIKEILSRSVWRTTPAEMSELLRLALVGFDAESAERMSEVPVLASDDARALHVGRAVLSALPDTSEQTILAHRWRIAEAVRDVIAHREKGEVKR